MQQWPRRRPRAWTQRRRLTLARWGATFLLVAVAIVLGRGRWPEALRPGENDPFPPGVSGAARPIDGDSLWVGGNEVRLKGIDAPEGRQTCRRDGAEWDCGGAARGALVGMIGGDTVSCNVSERDRYGRLLSLCKAGGRDLNAGMVTAGMAVAYGGYDREEGEAKSAKRGIWGSEFDMPRVWRDAHKSIW